MGNLNKCMIIGRLGQDPEMRYTPNGSPITEFGVAVGRSYTSASGEKVEETEWFNVVAFGRRAETMAQYLTKGREVYIDGRIQTRNWEGEGGKKHYRTELVADSFEFLGPRDSAEQSSYDPGIPVGVDAGGDVEPDDLPF